MAITEVSIATNRYAPTASSAINLYDYDLVENLTLGQLVQAVCIRTAAAYEAQSVVKMNKMTANSEILDEAADWLKTILSSNQDWANARTFLINKLGIASSALPGADEDVSSYDKRMQIAAAMQDKMNNLSQTQQEEMIDLQTMVNRRDVAFSTSSGVIRSLGQSMSQDAANFL